MSPSPYTVVVAVAIVVDSTPRTGMLVPPANLIFRYSAIYSRLDVDIRIRIPKDTQVDPR